MKPLTFQKFISINGSCATLVAECHDRSLSMFKILLEEARKSFPELEEKDAECFHVTNYDSPLRYCPVLKFFIKHGVEKEGWKLMPDDGINVW